MTTRSSRATIAGLRLLVREKDVPPRVRLRAIELLCNLEGFYDSNGKPRETVSNPPMSDKLRRLMDIPERPARQEG